jgi:hypothetical protein
VVRLLLFLLHMQLVPVTVKEVQAYMLRHIGTCPSKGDDPAGAVAGFEPCPH